MHRLLPFRLLLLLLLGLSSNLAALERFDFSVDQVEAQWHTLTGGMRGPFPTAKALKEEAARYPALLAETLSVLEKSRDNPRLEGLDFQLSENDYRIISTIVAEAWTALFNGDFEKAYQLGQLVGPPGLFPGLYARALQAQYLESDEDNKERLLKEVMNETARLLEKQPEHGFARFGNAYAKSRLLEPMGALAARRTGYMEEVQEALDELLRDDPDNVYALSLQGGLYSGIIDKAGSWLARRRFGVEEEMVDQVFKRAMAINDGFAAPMLEYAIAMQRVWGSERQQQIDALLSQAANVEPVSAEEALVVKKAKQLADQANL